MKRRPAIKLIGLALAAATAFTAMPLSSAQAEWPERPITMIVPWGAGGGTDAVGRILGALLEKDLGQPVNVVNRTGGSGVVGHSAIATANPDGYTIGVVTVEIAMMHWVGLTDLSYKDYTVFGQVNLDPGGLMVRKDSPYKTAADLLAAIKSQPASTFKGSGTGQGRAAGPESVGGGLHPHAGPQEVDEPGPREREQLAHPEPGRTARGRVEEALPPAQVDGARPRRQHPGTGQPRHLAEDRQHRHERPQVRGVRGVGVLSRVLMKTMHDLPGLRFAVSHRALDGDICLIRWQFDAVTKGGLKLSFAGMC